MSYKSDLRKIDVLFERSDWPRMEAAIARYDELYGNNDAAMDALDAYLAAPMVAMSLPATFMY